MSGMFRLTCRNANCEETSSMSKFSLGSDPEFMLVDKNGVYRSAIEVVQGTKKRPVTLKGGHTTFWDNVLAECCPKYGRTKDEVINNFRECFQGLAELVAPLRLTPQASHTYPKEECQHPGALEFGCEPELNAYEMRTVMPPSCAEGNTFRSGGGHIHIGHLTGDEYPLKDATDIGKWWTARYMDWFVGLPSLIMDTDPTSQARRKLYGGAGNLRMKPYGIEYRTLSVFWLKSPVMVSTIWDLCELCVDFLQDKSDDEATQLWEKHQAGIRSAIDTGDKKQGLKLLGQIAKPCNISSDLIKHIRSLGEVNNWDFYKEWKLK